MRRAQRAPALRRRVADGALLDLGHARRDAEQHPRPRDQPDPVVDLVHEVLDHLLGDVEVADDAVAERADRDDWWRASGRPSAWPRRRSPGTRLVFASIATTDGSLMTIPRSRTWTSVLAVPRSIPMSREKRPRRRSSMVGGGLVGSRCGGSRGDLAGWQRARRGSGGREGRVRAGRAVYQRPPTGRIRRWPRIAPATSMARSPTTVPTPRPPLLVGERRAASPAARPPRWRRASAPRRGDVRASSIRARDGTRSQDDRARLGGPRLPAATRPWPRAPGLGHVRDGTTAAKRDADRRRLASWRRR